MRRQPEPDADRAVVAQLVGDGLLERRGGHLRTTRRWHSALARVTFQLLSGGGDGTDLRVPIAAALVGIYGEDCPDDVIAERVGAMLPIQADELDPSVFLGSAAGP